MCFKLQLKLTIRL